MIILIPEAEKGANKYWVCSTYYRGYLRFRRRWLMKRNIDTTVRNTFAMHAKLLMRRISLMRTVMSHIWSANSPNVRSTPKSRASSTLQLKSYGLSLPTEDTFSPPQPLTQARSQIRPLPRDSRQRFKYQPDCCPPLSKTNWPL